jgi:hypothetical protein
MRNARRIGAFLAATVVALTLVSVVAAPVSAGPTPTGPQPFSTMLGAARINQPTWLRVYWQTDVTICDAKLIVASKRRIEIGYPGSTVNYASFYRDDTLTRGETDYTSFLVTAHSRAPGWVVLEATMTYTKCGTYGGGRSQSLTTAFLLPVHS